MITNSNKDGEKLVKEWMEGWLNQLRALGAVPDMAVLRVEAIAHKDRPPMFAFLGYRGDVTWSGDFESVDDLLTWFVPKLDVESRAARLRERAAKLLAEADGLANAGGVR